MQRGFRLENCRDPARGRRGAPQLIGLLTLGACLLALGAGPVRGEEPLHRRIDQRIAERARGEFAPRSGHAEFLRRVYLDLAGRIPTSEEARAFLADSSADKRVKLVEQLLAGPDYPRRMTDLWNVMLMERLGDHGEWSKYLFQAAAQNKPWDRMVREFLYVDANDESNRGAAFFLSKRLENYGQNPVDYPGLVRDVGRMFLGIDVQCAQCHDHLFVKQYTQDYFQGLFAFLGQSYLRTDVKFPAVAEKLVEKKVQFTSVFTQEPRETGPRLPGLSEVAIPAMAKGEEWIVPPDRKTNFPGVPKFSPLKALSEQLPRSETASFARNGANRLWWVMMGRGLVHPLDLHHDDNPASHPELLDLLAGEFAAHQFDMKWLLRELALTETYQRSSVAPPGVDAANVPLESYRVAIEKPLSSEQMLSSTLVASGLWTKFGAAALAAPDGKGEATEFSKLRERFAKAMANPPREPETEYSPSVRAALFLANDSVVLGWFAPADKNLAARLAEIADPGELARELYLAVLTRAPSDDERAEVAGQLNSMDARGAVVGRLIWALVNSTEFSVNH